jgi:hypothetical protein
VADRPRRSRSRHVRGGACGGSRGEAPDERLGQADTPRRRSRRGARLREHRAAGRRGGRLGNFVRIDMEDSSLVDATLRIYRGCARRATTTSAPSCRRTFTARRDLESLLPLRPNLRIVKGRVQGAGVDRVPKKADVGRCATTASSSAASRRPRSRQWPRTTSGGSRRRWRTVAGPTGWSSRCSTACGRSSSSTSSARAAGAGRDSLRPRLVPVPDAAAGRAAREPLFFVRSALEG